MKRLGVLAAFEWKELFYRFAATKKLII